ncbi:MAG: tRNA 4-thiouridine(8) synthase ThiI [candidate division KSB1 bacterium]|nr:tRNA 4-thiouridine(8) synthase ThiI [candidate division KSB1 bacterium]MDZ7318741.1 tRNA 4-thiouridine(8) synthase ThiI [candidate division KSB1 bacterium]MDZ7340522.1 tRNA 4-thiouridine(8) synthase ThiI [candidate division KSB1 bacterium]
MSFQNHSDRDLTFIIHYSEIGLKKGNRGFFESRLRDNILKALADCGRLKIKMDFGRFILHIAATVPPERIVNRLKQVIGIAHFSIAHVGDTDVHVLKEQVFQQLKDQPFRSFKIATRRADKQYPLTSVQVNQIVGEKIFTDLRRAVDLQHPELTCNIEIFNKKVFFHFERQAGIRGLPVGSSGKVVSLLSSGIDSPVASFRMMTRGCRVIFVHFHSFPFTDKSSYHNAIKLAQQLTRYQYHSQLYLVPLAKIQEAIIMQAPTKLRLILYRRMMFRLAELIARRERARALVTGESLGQVASQTLDNIAAISDVVSIPVLRPLIGMDKEWIVQQAKEINTFAISTEPYDDCCSYLVPKSPETHAKLEEVQAAENRIENWQELIKEAVRDAEIKKMEFPSVE